MGKHQINVISPHRDDAAFSLGLTIGACVDLGIPVRVVNCFTVSAYAPFHSATSVEEITELRASEDRLFRSVTGLSDQGSDLGYAEAPIRLPFRTWHVCNSRRLTAADLSDIHKLSEDLRAAHATGALLLPLAIGNPIDHRIVLHAGLRMCAGSPLGFYEDLPYACWGGATDVALRVNAVKSLIQEELYPFIVHQPQGLLDKRRMLNCYRSQIPVKQAGQILSYAEQFGIGERLWVTGKMRQFLIDQGLGAEHGRGEEKLPRRMLALRSASVHAGNAVRYKLAAPFGKVGP